MEIEKAIREGIFFFSGTLNFKKGIKLTFEWYKNNKTYYKSLSKKDIVNRIEKK